jgi:hypothetical protein
MQAWVGLSRKGPSAWNDNKRSSVLGYSAIQMEVSQGARVFSDPDGGFAGCSGSWKPRTAGLQLPPVRLFANVRGLCRLRPDVLRDVSFEICAFKFARSVAKQSGVVEVSSPLVPGMRLWLLLSVSGPELGRCEAQHAKRMTMHLT